MWLLVRSGPDEGVAVPVEGDVFVIGRQRGCDLVIRDSRASRRHLELRPAPGGDLRLRDLGSANGTLVDGRAVQEVILQGGEEIRIGEVRIDVARGAPPGGARPPAQPPAVPTYSGVRRLVEHSTRRARRIALAAVAVAALAVAVVLVVVLSDDGDRAPVPEVVAALSPSTVLVVTERDGVRTATGSGWALDARLVVTSAHVVNEGTAFVVGTAGSEHAARLLASAPCEDIALLELEGVEMRAAEVAGRGSVRAGETVVALGFGADATPSDPVGSTTGVVSVPRTAFRDPAPDVPAYSQVIQTDTALNPGNSGGPLADLDGRVVGINAAARTTGSDGRPLQNVNYAIPIDHARPVLARLRTGEGIAWIGLTFGYPTAGELAEAGLPSGLRITGAVPEASAAARAIAPGSLLVGVDGRPVRNTLESYCEAIGEGAPGEQVTLDVVAPGESRPRRVRVPLL